jgi:hypothetical protein
MLFEHMIIILLLVILVLAIVFVGREIRQKHLSIWLLPYLGKRSHQLFWPRRRSRVPVHVMFCMVDHFEPVAEGSTRQQERERMKDWLERYPLLAKHHRDSDGRPPQHTWFYPGENYRPEYLDNLVGLCRQGLGEIEIHLHHGNDTSESLREKIRKALADFSKHGALETQEVPPRQVYGFIHGNMALDNSMNKPELCGVDDEITVLKETGCYADFSMPTAPAISQPRKINTVYYAKDDPSQPKSHDSGVDVVALGHQSGDLMIIQGPLGLDWSRRKWAVIPKIENGEIQGSNPPSRYRITSWLKQHVHVKGRPEWVIVKVSCHGAEDRSRDVVLGNVADEMYSLLELEYRDQPGYFLHYVTARELYNVIKAAESGHIGNPNLYRNYLIPAYRTHSMPVETEANTHHPVKTGLSSPIH